MPKKHKFEFITYCKRIYSCSGTENRKSKVTELKSNFRNNAII